MTNIKSILLTSILSVLMNNSAMASQSDPDDPLIQSIAEMPKAKLKEFFSPTNSGADWVAGLPTSPGMIVTKLKNGQYMIMDANFRYAFYANNIIDITRGREVTSLEDMNDIWLIDTSKLNSNKLPIFSYGLSKPEADLYILMPMENSKVTKNITNFIKENVDKYRIDIMLMGSKNRQQLISASNFYCAKDRTLAKANLLNLIIPVKEDKSTWMPQHITCDTKNVIAALAIAKVYNVMTYPFLINPHGASSTVIPTDIQSFIQNKPTNLHSATDLTKAK